MKFIFLLILLFNFSFNLFGQTANKKYIMLHGRGGDNGETTWGTALNNLGIDGSKRQSISYDWKAPIQQTGTNLGAINATTPAKIWMGYSQGGLVARIASQSANSLGVVTVATPHKGAPIVDVNNENKKVEIWIEDKKMQIDFSIRYINYYCSFGGLPVGWVTLGISLFGGGDYMSLTGIEKTFGLNLTETARDFLNAPEMANQNLLLTKITEPAYQNMEPANHLNIYAETTDQTWRDYSFMSLSGFNKEVIDTRIGYWKDTYNIVKWNADLSWYEALFLYGNTGIIDVAKMLRNMMNSSLQEYYFISGNVDPAIGYKPIIVYVCAPPGMGPTDPGFTGARSNNFTDKIAGLNQSGNQNKLSRICDAWPETRYVPYTYFIPGKTDMLLPSSTTSINQIGSRTLINGVDNIKLVGKISHNSIMADDNKTLSDQLTPIKSW